jgi:L-fucose isomerase-like protein
MGKKTKNNNKTNKNGKIAIIPFTDPREDVGFVKEREEYIKKQHKKLKGFLEHSGYSIVDPLSDQLKKEKKDKNIWAVNNLVMVKKIAKSLLTTNIAGLIIECWGWTEPNLPLELVTRVPKPCLLITSTDTRWPGITSLVSAGATFWESSRNYFIKKHERFVVKQNNGFSGLLPWLQATKAYEHLTQGTLLLWGGSPALNMEHLNDDIPFLKRFIINDIINEGQFILINLAQSLLVKEPERITAFLKWLQENNCQIVYDEKMVTQDTLQKQIALYLAARDRVRDYQLKARNIIGTSIKCQPELSVHFGVTPCLLPAFLPFYADAGGPKQIIPTVCEGDIKGLLTSVMLFALNRVIPPLFGDVKIITDESFIIANCGAASAYYANCSEETSSNLANCIISAQCQGKSGGAFGYFTPASNKTVTFARLTRIDCDYLLQYGTSKISKVDPSVVGSWGSSWPHTAINLPVPANEFVRALGTNHLSLTLGDHTASIQHLVKLLGVSAVRIDNTKDIESFLERL